MKRTDKDRQDFAVKCAEIESQGGDVLGYIREHWPSYTPGATWFNLQRVYLPNKPMTDGKPKKEGGEEKMRRNRMEQLDGVLEAIRKGEHPYDYLEEQGYIVPMQALSDLKTWAKKNAPEKFEQMPSTLRGLKLTRKSIPVNVREEPAPDLKAGESLPVKLPEKTGDHISSENYRKTVEFNGKEYERMNKTSPTCCQPARPSGVTVPDALPDEPLEVFALKSNIKGRYQKFGLPNSNIGCGTDKWVGLIWSDRISHNECELALSVDEWLKLAEEIPKAMKQLGFTIPEQN